MIVAKIKRVGYRLKPVLSCEGSFITQARDTIPPSRAPDPPILRFQMSSSGLWACAATGDTPLVCHKIAFIPLVEQTAANSGVDREGFAAKVEAPADDAALDGHGGEDDVFVSMGAQGGNSGGGSNPSRSKTVASRMEKVECGGAVLSLGISRDDRFVMVNVRPFVVRRVALQVYSWRVNGYRAAA